MLKKCGIYKITNLVNGKFYIGSSKDLRKRRNDHLRELRENNHCNQRLQHAFNKYGEENFSFEVLEYLSEEEKYEKEQYYIDKLNACDKNIGYNISLLAGGACLKGEHNGMYGKTHSKETMDIIKLKNSGANSELSKKVYQYDLHGKLINIFDSMNVASRETGLTKNGIMKCCNDKYRSSNGYIWVYEENNTKEYINYRVNKTKEKVIRKNPNSIKIVQIDLNNKFIDEYNSIYEIGKLYNYRMSAICSCCKGNRNTAYNFKWMYADDYEKKVNSND